MAADDDKHEEPSFDPAPFRHYLDKVLDTYIKDPPKNEFQWGGLSRVLEMYAHAYNIGGQLKDATGAIPSLKDEAGWPQDVMPKERERYFKARKLLTERKAR